MTDTQTLTERPPQAATASADKAKRTQPATKSRRHCRREPSLAIELKVLWFDRAIAGASLAVRYAHSPRTGKLHLCSRDLARRFCDKTDKAAITNAVDAISGSGMEANRHRSGSGRGDTRFFNRNFYTTIDGKRGVMTSIGRLREYVASRHSAVNSRLQSSVSVFLTSLAANRPDILDYDPTTPRPSRPSRPSRPRGQAGFQAGTPVAHVG